MGGAAGLLAYLTSCAAERPIARQPEPVSTAATPPAVDSEAVDPAALPATPPASTAAVSAGVPDAATARQLAITSFMHLADAIKRKDFNALYATMAPAFRSSIPIQRVIDGFRPFTTAGVDLTRANPRLLVVTPPPHLDAKGVLILKGFMPTPLQTWYFDFGYLADEQGWAPIQMALSSHPE